MEMMHWYNPLTMEEEDVPIPMSDAQAIEMLSGHPDSDRFIEEYLEALVLTGETFYREHRRAKPPG
jgi:hypothetical protein